MMVRPDPHMTTLALSRQQAVERFRRLWEAGIEPDSAEAVRKLGGETVHRSVVIALAFEEYCVRSERGERPDAAGFAARFPQIEGSLVRQIVVHEELERRHLLDGDDLSGWPEPGDLVAGFLLQEKLGSGSFGTAFLAQELHLSERQVVVKVTQYGRTEAEKQVRVSHPGVSDVYTAASDSEWGLTVISMPFHSRATLLDVIGIVRSSRDRMMDGSCLARAARSVIHEDDRPDNRPSPRLHTGQGTFADAVTVFGYLTADALAAIHGKGLRHGDLKPSNIVVDAYGCPILIDFNLSTEILQSGPIGGTLPYMAPELLAAYMESLQEDSGNPMPLSPPGPAADIYSLGVCLYELLFGQHPFGPIPVSTNVEVADYLQHRQLLGPRYQPEISDRVDQALIRLLLQCLETDPSKRPASAAELKLEFEKLRSIPRQMQRVARVRPGLFRTSQLALLVAALLVPIWWTVRPDVTDVLERRVQQQIQAEDWSEAISTSDELIERQPHRDDLLLQRGELCLRLDMFDEAAEVFQRARQVRETPELLTRIAYCHLKRGMFDEAIDSYLSLPQEAQSADICNNLGVAYAGTQIFDQALQSLRLAVEKMPTLWAAHLNIAEVLHQQAIQNAQPTPPEAFSHLNEAVEHLYPTSDLFLLNCQLCSRSVPPDNRGFRSSVVRGHRFGLTVRHLRRDPFCGPMVDRLDSEAILEAEQPTGIFTQVVRVIPPW
ncbi:MAG: serine/threonine-protein kinase [Planctomycetaceae bacterium]